MQLLKWVVDYYSADSSKVADDKLISYWEPILMIAVFIASYKGERIVSLISAQYIITSGKIMRKVQSIYQIDRQKTYSCGGLWFLTETTF